MSNESPLKWIPTSLDKDDEFFHMKTGDIWIGKKSNAPNITLVNDTWIVNMRPDFDESLQAEPEYFTPWHLKDEDECKRVGCMNYHPSQHRESEYVEEQKEM